MPFKDGKYLFKNRGKTHTLVIENGIFLFSTGFPKIVNMAEMCDPNNWEEVNIDGNAGN